MQCLSASLSVCLCVGMYAYLTCPNFTQIFYTYCLWPWTGPFLAALKYVTYVLPVL